MQPGNPDRIFEKLLRESQKFRNEGLVDRSSKAALQPADCRRDVATVPDRCIVRSGGSYRQHTRHAACTNGYYAER
jgi:hypothetical protein